MSVSVNIISQASEFISSTMAGNGVVATKEKDSISVHSSLKEDPRYEGDCAVMQNSSLADPGAVATSTHSSLGSTPGRLSNVLVSPQSPRSPRSIFKNYWASKNAHDDKADVDSMRSPVLPKLPLDLGGETATASSTDSKEPATLLLAISRSGADNSANPSPTRPERRSSRRQILPFCTSPPPPEPERPTKRYIRPWSSTSALMKRPDRSCLRKPRYSSNRGITPSVGMKHSVSFFAQVSICEFTVPQEQTGRWASLFL